MQSASPVEPELSPRQQAEFDLLTQSGLGGLFFIASAAVLSLIEPVIWQHPVVAVGFFTLLILMMAVRLRFYWVLRDKPGFTLPSLYTSCLLGNALVWGVFAAWILSLTPDLNASSVLAIATTAGAASGGTVAMAMNLPVSRLLVAFYFLPMTFYAFSRGTEPSFLALGVLFVIFIGYLGNLAGKQHRAYWHMLEVTGKLRHQTHELEEARNEALAANASLQEARIEAEAAGNAKTEFLTHISHEIRTPLNGVIGMADLLASTPLNREQNEQVATILESGKLVLGLLNDVLNFSQVHSGQINLQADNLHLPSLVSTIFGMLQPLSEPRANQLLFTNQLHGLEWIKVDRLRLQQLFMNLLTNANKFTQNGTVELRLSLLQDETDLQRRLRCEVHDDGIGIDPEHLQQIFDPFFQVRKSAAYGRGTGLGLSICQRLVSKMNGAIGVVSEPGKGSCFWFEIPFVAGEPQPLESQPSRSDVEEPLRAVPPVLIVEDNLVNQKVISAFLNKLRYPCVIAANGAVAIEQFSKHRPTLVLMDCNLPDISGMDVTRQIRSLEQQQGAAPATIIAVTAHAFANVIQECMEAGMNDHIAKPVTLRTLQNVLDKWRQ